MEDIAVRDSIVTTDIISLEGGLRAPTEKEVENPWMEEDGGAKAADDQVVMRGARKCYSAYKLTLDAAARRSMTLYVWSRPKRTYLMMKLKSAFEKRAILLMALIAMQSMADEDYPIVWGSFTVQGIEQYPSLVVEGQEFELHFVGYHMTGGSGLSRPLTDELYEVIIDGNSIGLKFANYDDLCISPLPPGYIPEAPQRKILSLPGLPAGTYTVTADIDAY